MTRLRIVAIGSMFAVALAAAPSSAAALARVTGGGFIRSSDKTKTTLTISATDDQIFGDKGQAQLVRHTPGTKANAVHITLHCVHITGSSAIAAGVGADGNVYLIGIQDNGQGKDSPDAFVVVQDTLALVKCLGGLPTDVRLGTIHGGNYQVHPAG